MKKTPDMQNVILWVVGFLIASALATAKVVSVIADDAKSEFKAKFLRIANKVLAPFRIDSNLPLAQAALESNYGQSELTVKANNLFGMTPGSAWIKAMNKQIDFSQVPPWSYQGVPVVYFNTKEYSKKPPDQLYFWDFPGDIVSKKDDGNGGSILMVKRPFRAYASWDESILDWARHLSSLSIYKTALAGAQSGNLSAFVQGLQGVWATDPNYASEITKTAQILAQTPEAAV